MMSKYLVTNGIISANFICFNILLLFLDTEIFAAYAGSCLFFILFSSSFSLFIQLYFVYDVQWSEDQFHIFVNVTRDKIMSPTVIVTMAVVR